VQRDEHVPTRFDIEPLQRRRSVAGDRREGHARVVHHIADDLDATVHPFGRERLARAVVGRKEDGGDAVDLDPVVLLRHRQVAAAEPRLHMGKGHTRRSGSPRAGERRVRVAVAEQPVGPLELRELVDRETHHLGVRGLQAEMVARLREPELVEEDL
jgi:hypothetical protein